MEKIRRINTIVLTLLITSFCFVTAIAVTQHLNRVKKAKASAQKLQELEERFNYTQEAILIQDYYYKAGHPVRITVAEHTLKAIDKYLPIYFPEGPFTRRDFIAIVMLESDFDQYAMGKHGEMGLFQIMPSTSEDFGVEKNQFDIEVNVQLAMKTLQTKFNRFPVYKKAIIAYNGGPTKKSKSGISKWPTKYWNKFIQKRKTVDMVLGDEG